MKYIEFKNVSKVYKIGDKEYVAIKNISIEINKGEFVVVLGPSGAGKSTFLNLLGGMDLPTDGDIFIDGENIAKFSEKALTEYRAKNVGFVFQFYNILPTLTVKENLEIINDLLHTKKDPLVELKRVGLLEQADLFPSQISGGEQQRVSIARAFMKEPKLLLCDEPTGALDSNTGVEILKHLKEECEKRDGTNTVVVVTHNSLIADIADRVIKIKNGEVIDVIINKNSKSVEEVSW